MVCMDTSEANQIWQNFLKPSTTGVIDNLDPHMAAMIIDEISEKYFSNLPEWHYFDKNICFLPNLKDDKDQTCIKFQKKGNVWSFVVATPLRIRLEKIAKPPTCIFPKLPEQQLRWIREEIETDFRIRVYREIKAYKGADAAKEWFADGVEFRKRVEQMIPYMPAHKGFIYYKCWFHAQLLGETTMLREFTPNRVVVELERCKHLAIYGQNLAVSQMIDKTSYLELFDISWEDRAYACGWNADIEHHDLTTTFYLTAI